MPVSVSAVSSSSNGVQPKKAALPKVTRISRFSAVSPGYFYMKVAVPVAAGPPDPGIIHSELPAGCINRIRSYFMRLTTMQESLAEVFAPSIREREAGTLELIRETLRKRDGWPCLRLRPWMWRDFPWIARSYVVTPPWFGFTDRSSSLRREKHTKTESTCSFPLTVLTVPGSSMGLGKSRG